MLPVVTAAQMREFERVTIEEIGLPGAVLMETAGRKLAGAVLETNDPQEVAVVCGPGNNGGDGFVCARVLREYGVTATVYLAIDAALIEGDAALHLGAYCESGGVVVSVADPSGLEDAELEIAGAEVVVDALLGTGLGRGVDGHFRDVVEVINDSTGTVIAADIPSGLDADSGLVRGHAVSADATVTMGFAKIGMLSEPGFAYTGELSIAEIGIPNALASGCDVGLFERSDAEYLLPSPSPTDHKMRRGSVVVIGGSAGQRGAARLAARAAFEVGAGVVTWASPSDSELTALDPIMTLAIDRQAELSSWLPKLLARASAIVLGPGLTTAPWGAALVAHIVSSVETPIVADAAALGHLTAELLATRAAEIVLTPHPGEASKLLGCTTPEIQSTRLASARALAELGATSVLKGARTIVCDQGGFASINVTGNAGMATAGSGDVLAGMVGGLMAQGLSGAGAARLGVFLHGLAGDLAADERGALSMNAEDILLSIAAAIGEVEV